MMHNDLLGVARQLVSLDPSKPRQATLRRAASTAYYAIFHALCDDCVRNTVRWTRRADFWGPILPIYRAVDHATAKRVFSQIRSDRAASADLQRLAEHFIALQQVRLRADYDPSVRFVRARVLDYVADAELAIRLLGDLEAEVRLDLSVKLLTRSR